MAQNTSDSSECLTDVCRLEALEGKTKKTEDIAQEFVSRKCQNTSTRETFTNSKTSGKTSYPEVQTHHLALQTDETYEEQSVEQSVNLNEFLKNMPQEPQVSNTKIKHPSQNVRDPTEVTPNVLKHNIPETMTDGDIIVGHGKFKPTEPTDNATTKKPTQSVHTTKKVSSYAFLILTTILILVQLYVFSAFFINPF